MLSNPRRKLGKLLLYHCVQGIHAERGTNRGFEFRPLRDLGPLRPEDSALLR